jgi:hypothetical protein
MERAKCSAPITMPNQSKVSLGVIDDRGWKLAFIENLSVFTGIVKI